MRRIQVLLLKADKGSFDFGSCCGLPLLLKLLLCLHKGISLEKDRLIWEYYKNGLIFTRLSSGRSVSSGGW
ncbi:hypothetical protein HanPI659440_Chr14g0559391 [Helianthus annuus]|nr:hypothetical protein HanPI659440_Chr14g0559391 [Helianthus annuus]